MISVLYLGILSLFFFVGRGSCAAEPQHSPILGQQIGSVAKVATGNRPLLPLGPHPRIGHDLLPFGFDDSDEIVLKLMPAGMQIDGEMALEGASPLSRQFWALVKTQELLYSPRKEWSLGLKVHGPSFVTAAFNYHFH